MWRSGEGASLAAGTVYAKALWWEHAGLDVDCEMQQLHGQVVGEWVIECLKHLYLLPPAKGGEGVRDAHSVCVCARVRAHMHITGALGLSDSELQSMYRLARQGCLCSELPACLGWGLDRLGDHSAGQGHSSGLSTRISNC